MLLSSRRPVEAASTEDMGVDIGYGLLAITPLIPYDAVPVFIQTEGMGHSGNALNITSHLFGGGGLEGLESSPFFLGNYQHMDRGLGVDVSKGENPVVFIDDICGNFLAEDLVKKGVFHGTSSTSLLR